MQIKQSMSVLETGLLNQSYPYLMKSRAPALALLECKQCLSKKKNIFKQLNLNRFSMFLMTLKQRGTSFGMKHVAASIATIKSYVGRYTGPLIHATHLTLDKTFKELGLVNNERPLLEDNAYSCFMNAPFFRPDGFYPKKPWILLILFLIVCALHLAHF